jgi:hypothetical protein
MTWLAWRQQRTELLIAAGFLGLLLLIFIPTGIQMGNRFENDGIDACLAAPTAECAVTMDAFEDSFAAISGVTTWFGLVPILVGVLFAAPLVLELERGTYRLAWTQSISRERWIVTKLLVIAGSALLFSLAITLLLSWWQGPLDRIYGRIDPGTFQLEGTAPLAYGLFAAALTVALGSWLRRTVAAIGLGVVLFLVVRIGIETWLRPHYQAALETTGDRSMEPVRTGWILSDTVTAGTTVTTFQPDSRFWSFQGIETAIFLLLSIILFGLAFVSIRNRAR